MNLYFANVALSLETGAGVRLTFELIGSFNRFKAAQFLAAEGVFLLCSAKVDTGANATMAKIAITIFIMLSRSLINL